MRHLIDHLEKQDPSFPRDTPITELDDRRWKQVCDLIATLHLPKLNLSGINIFALKADRWKQLCDALATNSHIIGLEFSDHNSFSGIDKTRFEQFCIAIATNSSIINLKFSSNNLDLLDDNGWKHFCALIGTKHIQNLNLDFAGLANLNADRWKQFRDIVVASRSMKSLNLRQNSLQSLDDTRWKLFCDMIARNRSLTSLNLDSNALNALDATRLKQLMDAIAANTGINELDLSYNHFNFLNSTRWKQFIFDLIANPRIKKLALQSCRISAKNDSEQWAIFCDFIACNRNLSSLNIGNAAFGGQNIIITHDGRGWEKFCEAIANTNLTHLGLDDLDFSILGDAGWKQFCNALATNRSLTSLSLTRNKLAIFNASRWEQFCAAIAKNPTIVDINLNGNYLMDRDGRVTKDLAKEQKEAVQKILDKNRCSLHLAAAHSLHEVRLEPDLKSQREKRSIPPKLVELILNQYGKPDTLNKYVMAKVLGHKDKGKDQKQDKGDMKEMKDTKEKKEEKKRA